MISASLVDFPKDMVRLFLNGIMFFGNFDLKVTWSESNDKYFVAIVSYDIYHLGCRLHLIFIHSVEYWHFYPLMHVAQ